MILDPSVPLLLGGCRYSFNEEVPLLEWGQFSSYPLGTMYSSWTDYNI